MLDTEIIDQLRDHFAGLSGDYTFRVSPSDRPEQEELLSLLGALASASSRLRVEVAGEKVSAVRFELLRGGEPTGVAFRGVPGGHEFTSLVLAILNADEKGKLPDEGIRARIVALRGKPALRTYVSLSCTNCPEVVQALNQIALLGGITHEMVDGSLAEDEVESLGIQAVPTVVLPDGKVLHVGRSNLGELLERLETELGTNAVPAPGREPVDYDVVVIGAGPAGASAAIYSARKGLSTALVTHKLGGQVAETVGIENLVSVPYTEGARLTADLEKHVRSYPIELLEHRKVQSIERGERTLVKLASGEVLRASSVIVATGAKWRELGVPGEKEYLGRGVAFCPHCDGPFYKGRPVAVVGGGNSGVEAAIDLAGICSHVTLVEFMDRLKADDVLVRRLESLPNVDVVTSARVTEVAGDGSAVTALRYQDRKTEEIREVPLSGVFVQIGLVPNSGLFKDVLETNRYGEIVVDARGRTSAPGIYAAGDVTTVPFKQIVIAMGEGAKAALTAFEDRIRAA
ncbi:MAG TPA: alkyl hydroperoxide reductase subunit F [Polyangiaceae bacterium]|nr:alkyl hydroperoxide reductase subunit F [Polyangiaceae bacterium]